MFSGEKLLQFVTESISTTTCNRVESVECRDDGTAFTLKMVAIVAILISGIFGVALPLIGKERKFLRTDGNLFFTAKAFAAGVILATGFVHMLSSGSTALSNPCLPETPWKKFPFSGFIAMMASLLTLVADFIATQFYERNQEKSSVPVSEDGLDESLLLSSDSEIGIAVQNQSSFHGGGGKVFGEEEEGGIHIVGIHAHAAHHSHSHLPGKRGCKGHVEKEAHGHSHGHSHSIIGDDDDDDDDVEGSVRHVIVSQILELGIVSHSMIIGLSLGVSHSPCTIRPLIAALSFHQFFEGFALGGCISQALLKKLSTIVMACFFAITTPAGIAMGTGIASLYNPNSPRALAIEGILDSISAGILIYMALVDLIAADFLSKRIRCDVKLQIMSYIALFLGAGSMSLLAIWA